MNTVLIILSMLGCGALAISVYVFAVAARRYVSEEDKGITVSSIPINEHRLRVLRSDNDRRKNSNVVQFPLLIDGAVVERERRILPDRRRSHAA